LLFDFYNIYIYKISHKDREIIRIDDKNAIVRRVKLPFELSPPITYKFAEVMRELNVFVAAGADNYYHYFVDFRVVTNTFYHG